MYSLLKPNISKVKTENRDLNSMNPPPPPRNNHAFRGLILGLSLLAGLATPSFAQDTHTVSLSLAFDRPVTEGDSGLPLGDTLIVTINPPRSESFQITINNDGTAVQDTGTGGDFVITPDGASIFSGALIPRSNNTGIKMRILIRGDQIDEPDETVMLSLARSNATPADVAISATAGSITFTIEDDDPTLVNLARTGSSAVDEGSTVEFTVTLGRSLIAGEIIDVPLTVSGTNITTADWSLAAKTGDDLNTGVTLVNETTATPVVRFSDAAADTATLILTAVADNIPEAGGPETLTLALGPNDDTANGFDLNTRMTNVGGGADPDDDAANNTFNVTINDDMTAPVPDVSSLTAIAEQCELRRADLPVPTATDNQMGTVTVTSNITNFPITSNTTITWTYTDPTGNTSTQTQQVTIRDTTPPSVTGTLNEFPAQCEVAAATDLTVPTATDNCDEGTITATTNAAFPITSTTTITWIYRDATGNTSTQTQQVTINDTTDPVPVTADLPTLEDCSQITSLTAPTALDNCDGTIMGITNITPPITASTTLTWTYTDAGNNAVTQTQEVVINSNVLIPDVPSLPTLTDQCRIATLTAPTAMNCSGNTITAATTTNLPITTSGMITWTYTDAGNNTITQTQQVTIDDITDPVPTATDLPTLEDCSQITSLNAPTATDNCDGTITANTNVTPPVTTSTTIMWTYTDAAGNMSTQTQEVMIRDTMNPVPDNTLSALTSAGPLAQADVTVPTATDNCDGEIMAVPDVTFPITSDVTITWTYTDAAGNTATQMQQVTITEAPLGAVEDVKEAIVFPNPSGRYLEVRSPVGGTFQLLSLSGKPLLKGTTNTRTDITFLQSGLYLVQLPDGRLLKFVRK